MAAAAVLASPCPADGTSSGPRREFVDRIIVHAIGGPSCAGGKLVFSGAPGDAQRWKDFFDRHPFLGIHYVVGRDGRVLASTPEDRVANHALDNNATSIGIELVHEGDGIEAFGKRQIDALIGLLKSIRSRYQVPIENIKSHSEVDRRTFACGGGVYRTKMDPGANFPWGRVRAAVGTEPALTARPASPPQHRTR